MNIVLTADFGSTYTKLTAVDIENVEILGTAKSFTTIETDVREGYENALKELTALCGRLSFSKRIASSSAAGGLKMISCGLVPELTAKASKMAASSAGAKVLKTYSYELNQDEMNEIESYQPDIILLSGGIDGGNKDVILNNALMLSKAKWNFSVIVAGNKTVAPDIATLFTNAGKRVIVTENVMPEFNKLNIMPAKNKIRELFIENIIEAKGLNEIQKDLDQDIVPTPLAVYEACELLSKGTKSAEGLGHLMAYDVGGATTDVYSMAPGEPTKPNVVLKGFLEPYAKRSVEGDIGVRYSISSLVDEASPEAIAAGVGITPEEVLKWVETCKKDPGIIPAPDSVEKRIDEELAAQSVLISANRHCGQFEKFFTPVGETYMQTGKDLSNVSYIIGAGGSVINSRNPAYILNKSLYDPANYNILKPQKATLLLDKRNIFASMGLIGSIYPEAAINLMKKEFVSIN